MDRTYDSTTTTTVQVQQPPKFSRYRSVRRAAAANAQHTDSSAPPPIPTNFANGKPTAAGAGTSQNESIKRSMSRYRHAKPSKIVTSIPPPPLPSLPSSLNRQHADIENWIDKTVKGRETPDSQAQPLEPPNHGFTATSFHDAPKQSVSQPSSPRFGSFSRILGRGSLDQRREKDNPSPPKSAGEAQSSPFRRLYSAGREESSEATRNHGRFDNLQSPTSPLQFEDTHAKDLSAADVHRSTLDELLANERATAKHNGPSSNRKLVKERDRGGGLLSRFKSNDTSREGSKDLKTMISSPKLIDPLDLPSPLDDTPVSAVNSGERRVLVTCNDSFITLPITPTTKAQDLLHSASNCLAEPINPKTAVVMESFKQLGIERALRRYEHVRDIMNSWDDDTQNHLEVVTAPDNGMNESLDVRSAPRKQPKDATFHIYHCHRQGKWEKRYITLRSDGQVLMAKKLGGENTNLCHMSDFDIYSLKRREYRRVKPPKKYCFVIKSQQKASMFLSSNNFAHFFCMNDYDIGSEWFHAVQEWRSWYLVSVMGEGDTKETAGQQPTNRFSIGSGRYQLGSFKPLVDINAVANEAAMRPPTPEDEDAPLLRRPSINPAAAEGYSSTPLASAPSSPKLPPINPEHFAMKKRERSHTTTTRRKELTETEPFAATGLLGRTYTVRQNAMREREKELAEQNNPFTMNGLLNNLPDLNTTRSIERPGAQSASKPPSRESSHHNRPRSFHQQLPKPLVDLTPSYMEPAHHTRKGRGVAAQPGTLLVDNATGPELCPGAIVIPSATVWRRQGQQTGQPHRSGTMSSQTHVPEQFVRPRQRSQTMRNAQQYQSGATITATSTAAPVESPFIPTGLLAQTKFNHAQGSAHTGRGVATGDRQGSAGPLLDVSEPSRFADGSLLRSVEHHGAGYDGAAVIDREKKDEKTVQTGEGY